MSVRHAAVLFDLDQTLVESPAGAHGAREAVAATLRTRGYNVSNADAVDALPKAVEEIRRAHNGHWPLDFTPQTLMAQWCARLGVPEDLAPEIFPVYRAAQLEDIRATPHARATVHTLAQQAALGIVSNGDSDWQRRKLERSGLAAYFRVVTISGDLRVEKPHVEMFHHTLRALGVAPADGVHVGDNYIRDVRGALDAGLDAVWLNVRDAATPAGTHVRPLGILHSLKGLSGLLGAD